MPVLDADATYVRRELTAAEKCESQSLRHRLNAAVVLYRRRQELRGDLAPNDPRSPWGSWVREAVGRSLPTVNQHLRFLEAVLEGLGKTFEEATTRKTVFGVAGEELKRCWESTRTARGKPDPRPCLCGEDQDGGDRPAQRRRDAGNGRPPFYRPGADDPDGELRSLLKTLARVERRLRSLGQRGPQLDNALLFLDSAADALRRALPREPGWGDVYLYNGARVAVVTLDHSRRRCTVRDADTGKPVLDPVTRKPVAVSWDDLADLDREGGPDA
jgi:hypothetical protein